MVDGVREDGRRRRRSFGLSFGIHGLAFGLLWLLAEPGQASVAFELWDLDTWFDEPRFTPGAVVEFELSEPLDSASSDPSRARVEAEPQPARAEPGSTEPGSTEPAGSTGPRGPSEASVPAAPSAALRDEESPGEDPAGGLLASGRSEQTPATLDLGGSGALYAESVGERGESEGPQRRLPRGGQDYVFEVEGGKRIYRDPGGTFVATLQPDGGVQFENKLVAVSVAASPSLANNGERFIMLKVEYDPVGVARLARGRDPSPRVKAALLAATFDMRLELAAEFQRRRLTSQLNVLADELEHIWASGGLGLDARRQLLFERWDECEEFGPGTGFRSDAAASLDDAREHYAGAARRKILAFIRRVAPAGSPEAYSDAELERLNRGRVSATRFAPYGPRSG